MVLQCTNSPICGLIIDPANFKRFGLIGAAGAQTAIRPFWPERKGFQRLTLRLYQPGINSEDITMRFSIWELLLILAIVLVLFGSKRLSTLGSDLGNAIKGFRDAMREGEKSPPDEEEKKLEPQGRIIDTEATPEGASKDKERV
jgi:sec-independent protein translocase protein TatA